MGLASFPEISENLIKAGMPADTPAIAIEKATMPRQRHCSGTVKDLPEKLVENDFEAPTLIVVGRVISLAEKLTLNCGGT